MWRLVGRRVLLVLPLVVAVAAVNFTLVSRVPGDPVTLLFGEGGSPDPETLGALRRRLALDQPVAQRFVAYAAQLARGNLGTSISQGRPVGEALRERLPATLLLMAAALVLASLAGVALGIALARLTRRARRTERATFLGLLLVANHPPFVAGLLLILFFGLLLGVLPSYGMTSARGAGSLDVLQHLVLPALTLALQPLIAVARVTRARVLDVMQQAFLTTARGAGVPASRLLARHVLRNSLTAPVTILALTAGHWAGGAVITESVFAWPGIGRLAVEATLARDYPLILGVILTGTIFVVAANLAADLILVALDPRTRDA